MITIKLPKTEEEIIQFTIRTGLVGLSLMAIRILFGVLICGEVVINEPNTMLLYGEIGLVFGFLGSAFAKPRETP